MRKALRLGLLVTVVSMIAFHYSRDLNPRDEDLLIKDAMEDTLPYNPHRVDSGAIPDTSLLYKPQDTTPYKGNYIDIN
jgi:hypothetical protein